MSIYLIGDGILENKEWLKEKEKDLQADLTAKGFKVHNFAQTFFTVQDILYGKKIKNKTYEPLKNLPKSFSSVYGNILSDKSSLAVLSMGGNDINAHTIKLVLGTNIFINSVLSPIFVSDYEKVIEKVKANTSQILLISVYLPYLGVGSSFVKWSSMSKEIISKWNTFVYSMAKKYDIPVLDLALTLDPQDKSCYSEEIHCSNKASTCIAECINYIYKHYQGYSVYYAPKCDSSKITMAY